MGKGLLGDSKGTQCGAGWEDGASGPVASGPCCTHGEAGALAPAGMRVVRVTMPGVNAT